MVFDLDNMYCGAVKRGDIFLCRHAEQGEQVVVVLQDSVLNERLATAVVVPLEPYGQQKVYQNEVLFNDAETGFGETGIAMLHKIHSVRREQLVAKKGEVSAEKLDLLLKALDVNLGRFRDEK